MADNIRTIDLTPTWRQAAQIIAAALENGTAEGREAARAELYRMGDLLDAWNAERKAAAEAATSTDAATVHLIAKATTDDEGRPLTVYWAHGAAWTNDPWAAAHTADRADAERDAAQWSDYWASKGFASRAHVETFTRDQLDRARKDAGK